MIIAFDIDHRQNKPNDTHDCLLCAPTIINIDICIVISLTFVLLFHWQNCHIDTHPISWWYLAIAFSTFDWLIDILDIIGFTKDSSVSQVTWSRLTQWLITFRTSKSKNHLLALLKSSTSFIIRLTIFNCHLQCHLPEAIDVPLMMPRHRCDYRWRCKRRSASITNLLLGFKIEFGLKEFG